MEVINMKRKTISIILALALCVSLAVPAFAVETVTHKSYGSIFEITNVISQESYTVPVGDFEGVRTDYYTTAPTTITLRTDADWNDGSHEGCVEKIEEDSDGYITKREPVKPVINGQIPDGDSFHIPAGSYYTLNDEGIYRMFNMLDFSSIIIFVGGSDTPPTEKPSSSAVEQVNAAIAANLVPQSLQSKYTQATTRAEFCALAVALYENLKGEITGRTTFTDTNDINVQKCASIGVVSGVGNNRFDPTAQLTREQAAAMLARLADAIGKPLPTTAATFADNGSISSWAIESVGQIQAAGIMGGVGNNTFAPKDPYTREQSIITIMRLFDVVK
jgi:hypothetical protein